MISHNCYLSTSVDYFIIIIELSLLGLLFMEKLQVFENNNKFNKFSYTTLYYQFCFVFFIP